MSARRLPVVAWALAAGLAIATAVLYSPVRTYGFVELDDPAYVTENPNVSRGLTANGVMWALTESHSANWHPLTWISHMADVSLFGMNAGAHHVVNVVLHALCAAILLLVLTWWTAAPWRSAFVAAVFALHPLHVESVAWIAERKDVLSGFFFMLTLAAYAFYVDRPSRRRFALVAVAFACGLMAKPMLVSLPIVLLLIDRWPLQRWGGSRGRSIWPLVREKWILIALALISSVVTIAAQQAGGAVATIQGIPITQRLATAVVGTFSYLIKMVWPANLSIIYPLTDVASFPSLAPAVLVLVGLTFITYRLAKTWPAPFVGWLWYLVMLIPVSGIVQVGLQTIADRYTYLPMIGISIMVVWAIPPQISLPVGVRVAAGVAALAACGAMAMATRAHLPVWRDNVTLWTHATMVTLKVDEYEAHLALGRQLGGERRFDEARRHYELAAALRPDAADPLSGLGLTFALQNKFDEAIRHFQSGVERAPGDIEARRHLANAYVQAGHIEDAIREYRRLVALKPDEPRYAAALAELLKRIR